LDPCSPGWGFGSIHVDLLSFFWCIAFEFADSIIIIIWYLMEMLKFTKHGDYPSEGEKRENSEGRQA